VRMVGSNSILVVVDRGPTAGDAVRKAVQLARQSSAGVKLFACDAERAYALSQAFVPAGVEEARRSSIRSGQSYLEGLIHSLDAQDVPLSIAADCESPLYESIVRRVLREHPDLVIKSVAGKSADDAPSFEATDWQLMRTCPVTLLLTRGRPWRERPRIAAAIDASAAETSGLAISILGTAERLVSGAHGALDIIYVESPGLDQAERDRSRGTLRELANARPGLGASVHILEGPAEQTLAAFARPRAYDVMLLGALTHRPGPTPQVGTLTSRLVESLDCDVILVKPDAYRTTVDEVRAGDPPGTAAESDPMTLHRQARPGAATQNHPA